MSNLGTTKFENHKVWEDFSPRNKKGTYSVCNEIPNKGFYTKWDK